jgi:flagellin-like protein
MKANQAFKANDEAVSPVIGVILMVAITVVLAAVVFVLVSNLSKTSDKNESASAQVTSPTSDVISITLITQGEHAPYDLTVPCSSTTSNANCAQIAINGVKCSGNDLTGAGQSGSNAFSVGNSVRITGTGAGGVNACKAQFTTGQANVQVTITVAHTVIYDSPITIHQ